MLSHNLRFEAYRGKYSRWCASSSHLNGDVTKEIGPGAKTDVLSIHNNNNSNNNILIIINVTHNFVVRDILLQF